MISDFRLQISDLWAAFPAFVVCCVAANVAHAAEPLAWDTMADTWAATDGLGRTLPTAAEVGPPRSNRTVGMFYFLWLGTHGKEVIDISKLLAANPERPAWGPRGAFHWWGEPLFGYYRSDDAYVIRKHAQMLGDAGVDVWIFDVTNAFTYDDVVQSVCRVLDDIRRSGQRFPQIAFITHSRGPETVTRLYDNFYAKRLFPELWFRWKGKPLLLAAETGLKDEHKQFFTIRESWAWTKGQKWFGDGRDKWAWIDHYPQQPGWSESRERPEQISVCVAQHPVSNIGRSFHAGKQPPPAETAADRGLCFAEQWQRAREVDPEFVFVTGWNEWIAQRFESGGGQPFLGRKTAKGDTFFVDQYNQEFSRDIEPMRGGHGDNYYYQLAANIRRYKGARPLPAVNRAAIAVDGRFDDWKAVAPEFRDTLGDPARRDAAGYAQGTRYTNATGRNDIAAAKMTCDTENLYFYVRTREPLSPATDKNWMLLFLDIDSNAKTGWLGYDFVLNRSGLTAEKTTVEKNIGGKYQWQAAAKVDYRTSGNEMEIAIPLKSLGLNELPHAVDFKWADGLEQNGAAADLTLNGDVAPNDRFNYRATLQER